MLFLLSFLLICAFAQSEISTIHLVKMMYAVDDADCSGNVIAMQVKAQDLNTCESDGDGDDALFSKFTCIYGLDVVIQKFGQNKDCDGEASENTRLADRVCREVDEEGMRVKWRFSCYDGKMPTIDTSGMVGYTMAIHKGAGCSGSDSSSMTSWFKRDVCLKQDDTNYAKFMCTDSGLESGVYSNSDCTTLTSGSAQIIRNTCTDSSFGSVVASQEHKIIGCSGSRQLTLFALVALAFFRL